MTTSERAVTDRQLRSPASRSARARSRRSCSTGRCWSSREPGAVAPAGRPLLIAVPGLVDATTGSLAASNLGWYDVDPAEQLGLDGPAALVCNDAEAAALGESVLRPGHPDLVFIGLGTGIGGAVVRHGVAEANLFAHGGGFSRRECGCGRVGCLETVAGGWALPEVLSDADLVAITAEPRDRDPGRAARDPGAGRAGRRDDRRLPACWCRCSPTRCPTTRSSAPRRRRRSPPPRGACVTSTPVRRLPLPTA